MCVCVCVCVCACACALGEGGGLPVPLGEGGRLPLCHRNSSKHFLEAASKKTTKLHGYTSVHVKVAKNYKSQHSESTRSIICRDLTL